jgi:hypothetical protein
MVGTAMAPVLLSTIVVIVVFGGGDTFDPLAQLLRAKLLFAAVLTLVVSLIAAWKWEGIGGLFILGGLAFLVILTGDFPPNVIFWPTLVVGLIYLGCGWRRDRSRVERWRGGVGFGIFWVGVSPSVSQ